MPVCSVVFGICVEICCHLGKYSYEMKVCSVVWCGSSGRNLSFCGMRNYMSGRSVE